jgi:hypothetical protein
MTSTHLDKMNTAPNIDEAKNMSRYGITAARIDNYYYRGYHYTNLKDAFAQAKRDNAPSL